MNEIILINITGKDKPGLTAHLTDILATYKVNILDMGQAVIHDYLSLGILIEIPEAHKSSAVLKDLLFAAHKIDISVQFTPIDEERYDAWVRHKGKERRVITLLGRRLTADQIARVATAIAGNRLNIDIINRLSGRISMSEPDAKPMACIRLTVSGYLADPGPLRGALLKISEETGIDISFHVDNIYSQNRRLVVFDMDSTLIQQEVINELAKAAGTEEQVSRITEAAMHGEFDFAESLKRRVALLKDLPADTLDRIAPSLTLSDGANDLPMLRVAGLGVAYHAKPLVRQNAHRSISSVGLDGLLYLMGISEREIRQT